MSDYAERWWASKSRHLKPSTLQTYESAVIERVLPELGHLPIRSLSRQDILDWIAWAEDQRKIPPKAVQIMRARAKGDIHDPEAQRKIDAILASIPFESREHYAYDTLNKWWRVLVQLVRDAHADGYLTMDPTYRVKPPKSPVRGIREKRTLTYEQLDRLLVAVMEVGSHRYAEVVTMALTGMRAGEVYALTWDDIDLKSQNIRMNKAVWNGEVGPPKTGVGRNVPIADILVPVLQMHRKEQMRVQHRGLQKGLVFPSNSGGYRHPASLRKLIQRACKKAKIDQRVGPQVLRRTFNTLSVPLVDRIILRSIMGHSAEQMTELYTGVSTSDQLNAVNSLATSVVTGGSSGDHTGGEKS